MSYHIKQSTTAQPLVFLMLDSADHVTGKTGLSPTVTLSKAGGSFAATAGAVTEIGSGWYKVAGNATDTGTLGPLLLHATASGADPCDDRYEVVAFDPQDAVRLGLTALPNANAEAAGGLYTRGTGAGQINQANNGQIDVNAARTGGTTNTGRDIGASVLISSGTGTGQISVTSGAVLVGSFSGNAITAAALAGDASSEIAAAVRTEITSELGTIGAIEIAVADVASSLGEIAPAVWEEATASHVVAGSTGLALTAANTKLGTPAGASVSADIAAVKAETALIVADTGTDGVLLSASALTSLADSVCDEPLSGHTTSGTVGASLANVYAAQIDYVDDDTNDKDEFTVQWFRNGAPVTSGITSPTLQAIKRDDGTDLIAVTTMTQIGSTGAYKYDESTNRIEAGEAVLVQVQATIDGSARTWRKVISRDDSIA